MALLQTHSALQFSYPLPYGAIVHEGGVQFVVFSRSAKAMRLLLYDRVGDREPTDILHFSRDADRWGDVWSMFVPGIGAGQLYHFQADGPWDPEHGQRFDGTARLLDPYARALAGEFMPSDDHIIRPPKCVVISENHFDWEDDRHICRNLSESVIYEMHVRGFTQDPSSKVEHPGTYLGVIEKIPYLKSLGVTAVELMPIHEFAETDAKGNRHGRLNYWGYDPIGFFSPHRGFAVGNEPGAQVHEFKQMVRALHQAGIEVILDVVFNHTAEGNELGPTYAFRGLENKVYYMLGNGGSYYRNYSGCGNTVNGNHPIVREMIFHCLRHWVHNYHIDGFRFDLASILSRDRNGDIVPNPPIVEIISEDPLLADTKIIAEAWDAAGAYQVGSFAQLRWSEWNGRYRDDIRRFWRGDSEQRGHLATRFAGSSDLYQPGGRQPYHSINFVTSHDGFTMSDMVTYSQKHNEANGEGNRDGDNCNFSGNYGVEGPTSRPGIEGVRVRQIKNMIATLMLSQGVPMLLMGDECRRSQRGNNNAYCQDNEISWFNWRLVEKNADLFRFAKSLIAFRRNVSTVRRAEFLDGRPRRPGELPDVSWYSPTGDPVDWNKDEPSLMCLFSAGPPDETTGALGRHVLVLFHAGHEAKEFVLPPAARNIDWRLFVNTAAESPRDVYPDLNGPERPANGIVPLAARSLICFVSLPIPGR